MLAVSAGWGVTVANFTKNIKKVVFQVGIMYFVVSLLVMIGIRRVHDTNIDLNARINMQKQVLGLMAIQTMMDSILVFILLTMLGERMQNFKNAGETFRYKHYNKFSKCISMLASICLLHVVVVGCLRGRLFGDHGTSFMLNHFEFTTVIMQDFYHAMYLAMLTVIMILWRPTKSSKIYAFVQQLPTYVHNLLHMQNHCMYYIVFEFVTILGCVFVDTFLEMTMTNQDIVFQKLN